MEISRTATTVAGWGPKNIRPLLCARGGPASRAPARQGRLARLEQPPQDLRIDRLDQVMIEARLLGPPAVGLLAVPGQRDQQRVVQLLVPTQKLGDLVAI